MLFKITLVSLKDNSKRTTIEQYQDLDAATQVYTKTLANMNKGYSGLPSEHLIAIESIVALNVPTDITMRHVYNLPKLMSPMIIDQEEVFDIATKFVNQILYLSIDSDDFDRRRVVHDTRIEVSYVGHYNCLDGVRSTSLFVIKFDNEPIGIYYGSGRGERDHVFTYSTNIPKVHDLMLYLMSFMLINVDAETQISENDPVPNLLDTLLNSGVLNSENIIDWFPDAA